MTTVRSSEVVVTTDGVGEKRLAKGEGVGCDKLGWGEANGGGSSTASAASGAAGCAGKTSFSSRSS